MLESVVIHVEENIKTISKKYFENLDILNKAVLVHTGWDNYWKTD